MKKYLVAALVVALVGVSIAGIAQSAPMGHFSHGIQAMMGMNTAGWSGPMDHFAHAANGMNSAEMQTLRESMQKKIAAAKTDEERQALMTEQRKLMLERHGQSLPMNGERHGMMGMQGNMPQRQQMMQKHMGMMPM